MRYVPIKLNLSNALTLVYILIFCYQFTDSMWSLSGSETVPVFWGFFNHLLYVLPLSREEGRDPINLLNHATFLCMFQSRNWIFNVICHCVKSDYG